MALSSRNQTKIQSLSRADVVKTFGGLNSFLEDGRWIGKRNRYAKDTIETLRTEIATGSIRAPKQLSQYIAASSLLHCADGWSYLGASVSALLHGDPHRARHLAYYAELRAAMSLLATFGIGVFNRTHFVIDGRDSATVLPKKSITHEFVWDCIKYYSSQNALGDLFASIMSPFGFNLGDWLAPIGGSGAIAAQARDWFLQWGLDLQMPEKDHNARNESSYRPDGLPTSWRLNAPDVLSFVRDLWLALEPAPNSYFEVIDRHILRLALETSYRARYGDSRIRKRPPFERIVHQVVQHQSVDLKIARNWTDFLLRKEAPEDHVLLSASRQSPEVRDGSDTAIVARATLLLRAASGSALRLFQEAGLTPDSIAFWRSKMSDGRGLWENAELSVSPIDLWADIEPLLRDIEVFQESTPSANQTFFQTRRVLGQTLFGLGTCDRVAVWSLG